MIMWLLYLLKYNILQPLLSLLYISFYNNFLTRYISYLGEFFQFIHTQLVPAVFCFPRNIRDLSCSASFYSISPEDAYNTQPFVHPHRHFGRCLGPQLVRLPAVYVQTTQQCITGQILLPLRVRVRSQREQGKTQHAGEQRCRNPRQIEQSIPGAGGRKAFMHVCKHFLSFSNGSLKSTERCRLWQLPLHQEPQTLQQHHSGESADQHGFKV